jgi:hypothetical protein
MFHPRGWASDAASARSGGAPKNADDPSSSRNRYQVKNGPIWNVVVAGVPAGVRVLKLVS